MPFVAAGRTDKTPAAAPTVPADLAAPERLNGFRDALPSCRSRWASFTATQHRRLVLMANLCSRGVTACFTMLLPLVCAEGPPLRRGGRPSRPLAFRGRALRSALAQVLVAVLVLVPWLPSTSCTPGGCCGTPPSWPRSTIRTSSRAAAATTALSGALSTIRVSSLTLIGLPPSCPGPEWTMGESGSCLPLS